MPRRSEWEYPDRVREMGFTLAHYFEQAIPGLDHNCQNEIRNAVFDLFDAAVEEAKKED